jgi:hypothetical protein
LQYLSIGSFFEYGNLLTGSIPAELCALTELTYLDVSNNLLTGTIPECIGSSLTNLNNFAVDFNGLEGTFPTSLQKLTLLEVLDLGSNVFHGTFSGDWFENLTHVEILMFNDNNFSGTLASSLSTLSKLKVLNGSSNNFTGPLPEFRNAPDLFYILLADNQLTGTVPVSFSSLTALSKQLSCRTERICGSLRSKLSISCFFSQCSCCIYEETLRLQVNQLTGDVSFLCYNDEIQLATFQMDCLVGTDVGAEIACSCCTECCDESLAPPGEIEYCEFNY